MASSNLMAMQAAVNRFASVAGFAAIPVDGGMGTLTAQATLKALSWAGQGGCNGSGNCIPQPFAIAAHTEITAIISDTGAIDQSAIMQRNTVITKVLNQAADTIKLPGAPAIVQTPGGGGTITPITSLPPIIGAGGSFLTNLSEKFKALPTWQKAAIGVAGALVAIAGVNAYKNRKAA